MRILLAAAAFYLGFLGAGAQAQLSLEDIEAQLSAGASELDRVDQLLALENANQRIAAMTLLLQSDNPLFVRRARQVGLLSSDPDMQLAAVKAVLDAGGPMRFEIDFSGLSGDDLKRWTAMVSDNGTVSVDGKLGTLVFDVERFDAEDKCYATRNSSYCFAQIAGAKVSFPMGFWSQVQAVAALGPDGALAGEISYDGRIAPFRVPLVE